MRTSVETAYPAINYSLVKITDTEYYVLSERAARNVAYQGTTAKLGEYSIVATFPGKGVVGTVVNLQDDRQQWHRSL